MGSPCPSTKPVDDRCRPRLGQVPVLRDGVRWSESVTHGTDEGPDLPTDPGDRGRRGTSTGSSVEEGHSVSKTTLPPSICGGGAEGLLLTGARGQET